MVDSQFQPDWFSKPGDTLLTMMEQGQAVDIDRVVTIEKQQLIKNAIGTQEITKLKPLKEQLPEEISYDDIRFVLAGIALG